MDHEENPITKTKVLLLDGGLGTTLGAEPYNITYNDQTPLWSSHLLLSAPETLISVHKAFVAVGADIVSSNTYQASYEGFARTPRLDQRTSQAYTRDEAANYMRQAVKLVKLAVSSPENGRNPPAVMLSLGAYGSILTPSQEFSGIYPPKMATEDALAGWHKERLDVFRFDKVIWNEVDYVAFETIRPLSEIRGIRKVAYGIDKKWWISHIVPDEVHQSDIPAVVEAMLGPENDLAIPWGIGVNCTAVHKVGDVERLYRETISAKFPSLVGNIWLVLYPDGTRGEIYDTETKTWVKVSGQELRLPWEDLVMKVVRDALASKVWKGIVVGGCCKTLPEDIARLRSRIDLLENQ